MILRKTQFDDYKLMQLQQDIDYALGQVATEITKGRLIKAVTLSTSALAVEHKLNRIPEGYLIVGQNADARVWSTVRTEKNLSLQASSAVTVDLWVF